MEALFEAVGSRLVRYYDEVASLESVGACLSNDDWGFNHPDPTLTRNRWRGISSLGTERSVKQSTGTGKPALLHTCGNVYPVFDWIVESYEGKHSYEDFHHAGRGGMEEVPTMRSRYLVASM